MRSILLEYIIIILRNGCFLHNSYHHLRRSFRINMKAFSQVRFDDDTHSLKIWFEFIASINTALMISFALETKNNFVILWGLIEIELPKVKGFYFHRVSDEFIGCLYLDYRVIGCHIVQYRQVIRFFWYILNHILRHFFCICDLGMKFTWVGGNYAIKIHILLCQCSSFIKAGKLYESSSNNFILRNTKDLLLL